MIIILKVVEIKLNSSGSAVKDNYTKLIDKKKP